MSLLTSTSRLETLSLFARSVVAMSWSSRIAGLYGHDTLEVFGGGIELLQIELTATELRQDARIAGLQRIGALERLDRGAKFPLRLSRATEHRPRLRFTIVALARGCES